MKMWSDCSNAEHQAIYRWCKKLKLLKESKDKGEISSDEYKSKKAELEEELDRLEKKYEQVC